MTEVLQGAVRRHPCRARAPRRAAFSALICAALAGPAVAERVAVRAGEHGAFTRLTLQFPSMPEWSLLERDGGYSVATDMLVPEYDLSMAWRRIGRERVAGLAPQGADLGIDLACDCVADAFEVPPSLLVVDIRPADSPRSAPGVARPTLLPVLFEAAPPSGAVHLAIAGAPSAATPDLDRGTLEAFGAELALRLGEGAANGVIEPVRGARRRGALREAPEAISSAPSAQAGVRLPGPLGEAEPRCPDPALLSLAPSEDEPGPGPAITAARAALFGEFDRIDVEAARALVSAYLRAGLGAEARAASAMADLPDAEARLISEAARLIDGPPEPEAESGLEELAACGGSTAIFAVLALEGRPLPRSLDRGGLVAEVSGLAPEMRVHLVPRLAGALASDGDLATARLLLASAARLARPAPREIELLALRLAPPEGQGPDGALGALAEGRDDVALAAATLALERGEALPVEAIEVLLAERGGTAAGERLRAVAIAERIAARAWDDAAALAAGAPDGGASSWQALAEGLRDEPDDAAFVRAAYVHAERLAAAPLDEGVSRAIAARLDALGYAPSEPSARAATIRPIPPEARWWDGDAPRADASAISELPAGTAPLVDTRQAGNLANPVAAARSVLDESRRRAAEVRLVVGTSPTPIE